MGQVLLHVAGREAADPAADLAARLGAGGVTIGAALAAAAGVTLDGADLAFAADAVRVADGRLAGPADVRGDELAAVAAAVGRRLPGFAWHPLDARRHLVVYLGGWPFDLRTHPPGAVSGELVGDHEAAGAGDEVIRELNQIAAETLGGGRRLWLWGQGRRAEVPGRPSVGLAWHDRWADGLGRLLGMPRQGGDPAAALDALLGRVPNAAVQLPAAPPALVTELRAVAARHGAAVRVAHVAAGSTVAAR